MPNFFKDTPYAKHFQSHDDTNYFHVKGKCKSRDASFQWQQNVDSNTVSIAFPIHGIGFKLKSDNRDYKIGLDLGNFNLQGHKTNWFLNLLYINNCFGFKFGVFEKTKRHRHSAWLELQDNLNLAYQYRFKSKRATLNCDFQLEQGSDSQLTSKFDLTIPVNAQNDIFFQLDGIRDCNDYSFKCLGNNFGAGLLSRHKQYRFGLHLSKQEGFLLFSQFKNKKYDVKAYLDLKAKLRTYVTYKHEKLISISGGLQLPLNRLSSTCPMTYPIGCQLRLNL